MDAVLHHPLLSAPEHQQSCSVLRELHGLSYDADHCPQRKLIDFTFSSSCVHLQGLDNETETPLILVWEVSWLNWTSLVANLH